MSVEDLLCLLQGIEEESTIDDLGEEICLNWGNVKERHKLIQDAATLATDVLIRDDGERNYDNEYVLRDKGYGVIALEQDRSGWLLGGIITQKGIIAYG
jgi:hypothetical protein